MGADVGPRGQIGVRDVKPPQFEYHAPVGVDEAIALLGRYGGEAKLLAGGQSLMPLLNFRLARPAALVDLNGIGSLAYIREEDGAVAIGAMTRQRTIEFSPVVRRRLPLLTEATALVGHLPIRTRGTIGGSIAHADPSAEYPAVLTALDGVVVVRGPRGERTLKPSELFRGYLSTSLAPDDILVEVRLPAMPEGAGYAFEEFSRRHGDFAIVGVAALLSGKGGRCTAARLATAGAGPMPVRLRAAEEILERDGLGDESLDAAAARAAELVDPDSDIHASAAYRKNLTRVLTGRVLRRAMARMTESLAGCGKRPICFVGALGRTLTPGEAEPKAGRAHREIVASASEPQGVRLACGRRAPPRIWTFLRLLPGSRRRASGPNQRFGDKP